MKKNLILTAALFTALLLQPVSARWKPAGDRIKTHWAEKIDPADVLPEYPRPIMEREAWMNLNGLWNYAVVPAGTPAPAEWDGEILVPFCIESSLSGVQRSVGRDNELWYEREFTLPAAWKGQNILLHFGAVDFRTDVWVNGVKVGSHTGGYTPFSFDITPWLDKTGKQRLEVLVWDPTDDGVQAIGKQRNKPEGIWYTPVTGIWQTVWLEPVPAAHITAVKITPDLDKSLWEMEASVEGASPADRIAVTLFDNGKAVAREETRPGVTTRLHLADPKLWSPESPFLYDVEVELVRGGKTADRVKSYCAMRKIASVRDDKGVYRLQLNNEEYFQFGPLDQGWWPDGLYTAPTDEALAYDIVKTKELGFNMIRKHVKVEPARWYTHCDRLGVLVWQDMPSGDMRQKEWQNRQMFQGNEFVRSPRSEALYRQEWKGIMDFAHNYPSVVVWVPFNEAWGQFKTADIVNWTKDYDPSRLVNAASGGNHFPVGDMIDLHNYPAPAFYLNDGARRATVLGEYGGIGLALEGHLWLMDRMWGYIEFKTPQEVTDRYVEYARQLREMVPLGFTAAVYTQTTDVEGEVNGLMTYDRKVMKVDAERVRKANEEVIRAMNAKP